jgi:hypothetical protein
MARGNTPTTPNEIGKFCFVAVRVQAPEKSRNRKLEIHMDGKRVYRDLAVFLPDGN